MEGLERASTRVITLKREKKSNLQHRSGAASPNVDVKECLIKEAAPAPTDREQLKLEIISNFDAAEEYIKEAARLQQSAAQYQQKAMTLQKEALLKNLDYG